MRKKATKLAKRRHPNRKREWRRNSIYRRWMVPLSKMDEDSRTVPVWVTDNSRLLQTEIRTFTWKKQTKKRIKNKNNKIKNNKISLPNFCFFLFYLD